ncbi:MAG: cytochrome-c peroxidase [Flavisolibacter sp.]
MKSRIVILLLFFIVLGGAVFINGCKKSEPPVLTTPVHFTVPAGFPPPVYDFAAHPLTEEGFLLGRKLFYDGRLSLDGNFPCASCHQQVAAFTTFEHDRSHGYNHSHTLRNAPGLANLAWYTAYRQDGGAPNLEAVSLAHITAPDEMAESMDHVVSKLQQDTAYKRMFRAAFGNEQVTAPRILNALSQFVINLVSADAKYDRVKKGQASFTNEEEGGYTVFQAKCASCHTEPLFTDGSFRNTGLAIDTALKDYGRMRVTGRAADSLKFRVPSLRNVDLTSYYGHDGRYSMMRMMIQHYEYGVIKSSTLDPLLSNGISLTTTEENNLVAFLRTLSDTAYVNNPRFRE